MPTAGIYQREINDETKFNDRPYSGNGDDTGG